MFQDVPSKMFLFHALFGVVSEIGLSLNGILFDEGQHLGLDIRYFGKEAVLQRIADFFRSLNASCQMKGLPLSIISA